MVLTTTPALLVLFFPTSLLLPTWLPPLLEGGRYTAHALQTISLPTLLKPCIAYSPQMEHWGTSVKSYQHKVTTKIDTFLYWKL